MVGLLRWKPRIKPAGDSSAPSPKPAAKSPLSLISTTILLVLAVIVAAACALITALILRRYDYKQQIMINDFLTPAATAPAETWGDFGKEVSDLFASDLNDIIQQGSGFSGTPGGNRKSKISQPFDGIPKIPVSKSYGIEIQGVSIDQILKAWNALRYDQQLISGDIIPMSNSANQYVVQISLRSDRSAEHWTSIPFAASQKELAAAVQGLAESFVATTNPEIAGRYFLANKQYSRAVPIFADWLNLQPDRPEPSLYLAKTLIFEGQYDRAKIFADRTLSLAARSARKNRQQIQTEAGLAQADAVWGSGDFQNAEKLFSSAALRKQPAAITNLAVLYLEKARYADAEKLLAPLVMAGGNFAAAMVLGQTYTAAKNNSKAVDAFESALRIRPASTEAASYYLLALHADNRDPEAVQYCHSWVDTDGDADSIVSNTTRDLYLLCARAQGGVTKDTKPSDKAALAWYYSEALTRPEGDEAPGALFSDLVDSMPAVLCQGTNGKPAAQYAAATLALTAALRMRARDDQRAAAMVKDCEQSTARRPSP
jgi:tetratricopeptide (TPR) repeat protein